MTQTQTIEAKQCQCLPSETQLRTITQVCKHNIQIEIMTIDIDVSIAHLVNQNHVVIEAHISQFFSYLTPDAKKVKHTPITGGRLLLRRSKN